MSFADSVEKHNASLADGTYFANAVRTIEKKYDSMTEKEMEAVATIKLRDMVTEAFTGVVAQLEQLAPVVASAHKKLKPFMPPKKKVSEKAYSGGRNGLIQYDSGTGGPGEESIFERRSRERYWKSLGKKIRKGSSIH